MDIVSVIRVKYSEMLSAEISQRIRIARVICILAVIYVHSPPYDSPILDDVWNEDAIIWIIREALGRTSVPLLSIVSGYLACKLEKPGNWFDTLSGKIRTLIIPMILWNMIAMTKSGIESGDFSIFAFPGIADGLLGFTEYPHIVLFYFLRDMFICFLLMPIIVYLIEINYTFIVITLLINAIFNIDGLLFLNSAIPLCFTIGICIARNVAKFELYKSNQIIFLYVSIILSFVIIFIPILNENSRYYRNDEYLDEALLITQRLCGAIIFWNISAALQRRKISDFILRFEPFIFFVFCSHTLAIGMAWAITRKISDLIEMNLQLVFFIFAPITALLIGVAATIICKAVSARFLKLLMGGRIPSGNDIHMLQDIFGPGIRLFGYSYRSGIGPVSAMIARHIGKTKR